MTASVPSPETPASPAEMPGSESQGDAGRVAPLRGASVQLNLRRVLQVTVALVMGTLAVLVVVLTVAAVHSNNQIDELHDQGVPVTITVTSCLGLLGGSGSNPEGYSCHGTYVLDQHRYAQRIPTSTYIRPGTRIAAVAVPSDPALVSTASALKTQHSSAGAFVIPIVLGVVLLALIGLVVLRARAGARANGKAAATSHLASTT